jgi:hypothetical protein
METLTNADFPGLTTSKATNYYGTVSGTSLDNQTVTVVATRRGTTTPQYTFTGSALPTTTQGVYNVFLSYQGSSTGEGSGDGGGTGGDSISVSVAGCNTVLSKTTQLTISS